MTLARCLRFLCFTLIAISVHGQTAPSAREQTVFDENNAIEHSVSLPLGALKTLLQRREVRENLPVIVDSERVDPAHLFTVSEVHLSAGNQTDLVVIGKFPMSGADNTWFWVIRSARKAPFVVLFAGGNSLELLHTRTNGYRDVSSYWSTPNGTETRTYTFDGARYRLRKKTWRDNHQQ